MVTDRLKRITKTVALRSLAMFGLDHTARCIRYRWKERRELSRIGVRVECKARTIEITKDNRKIVLSAHDAVYAPDMAAHFGHYWDQVYPSEIGGFQVVDYSEPREQILKPSGVSLWSSAIVDGENSVRAYLGKYMPRAGDVVFDCGAYCGVVTYFLSRSVGPHGKVYAFEPDKASFGILCRNTEKHQLLNVIPVNKAIWSASALLGFNAEGNLGSALTDLVNRGCLMGIPIQQVETVTLADAYTQLGLDRLDFIKMDIEGAEIEAIQGSLGFIRQNNIHFAIANHPRDGRPTYHTVERLLHDVGYVTETADPYGDSGWSDVITWAWKPSSGDAEL